MRHCVAQIDSYIRKRPILIAISIVALVLILYAPVRDYGFLDWDDDQYVTQNPHVQTGLTIANVGWALTDNTTFYWHPVTWVSHMLDTQLFGVNAKADHLENVLLHALNAIILFFLLNKATGSIWRSAIVSGLFALHPITVETVAWISERKSLLSALFSLLMVAAYGWYIERREPKRYALVLLAFLLALMSKAVAVTMPVLLLLLDYWPLKRVRDGSQWSDWRQLIVEKVPLFLMSAISGVLIMRGQDATGAVIRNIPLAMRFEQVIASYAVYLRKLAWPNDLAGFYPYHMHWYPWLEVLASAVVLTTITVVALNRRVPKYVAFGWFLFLVALLPVAGWMPTGRALIADRFTYIPAIGIFIALVWSAADLSRNRPVAVSSCALLFGALLTVCAYRTSKELPYWSNAVTLFTRAAVIERTPEAFIENKLGDALQSAGQASEALQHYFRSCELEPEVELCHFNIAQIAYSLYDERTAVKHYLLAAQYTSSPVVARLSLTNAAGAMMSLGDLSGAERILSNVLRQDPSDTNALRLMSFLRAKRAGLY